MASYTTLRDFRWYDLNVIVTCNALNGGQMYRLLDTHPAYNALDRQLFLTFFIIPDPPGPYQCEYRNVMNGDVVFPLGYSVDGIGTERAVFMVRFAQMQFDDETGKWRFVQQIGNAFQDFAYVNALYERTVESVGGDE